MRLQNRLSRFAGALALLLCAIMVLYAILEAFGPRGFSFRDESFCFHQALSFRLGFPWIVSWGNGNLLKFIQFSLYSLTGNFQALHVPALLAIIFQAGTLFFVGNRLGGPRVGQGAMLASLISAMVLIQGRSLLSFAILPFLLALSLALSLKKPKIAFLGGVIFACGFLEYEGVAFALPGIAAFFFFEPKVKRFSAWTWSLGLIIGLSAVLWFCRHSMAEWWAFRMAYNRPFPSTAQNPLWIRLWQWFIGGHPDSYLGISNHGTFPMWALPLALIGFFSQIKRRPWLILWTVGALVALLPASIKLEPQRAISALVPLAIATGFGWRCLWQQARRRIWLAVLILILPIWGLVNEIDAFEASMLAGQSTYARSQVWHALSRDPAVTGNVNAALLPMGLTLECALGAPKNALFSKYVWVPSDLDLDLPLCPIQVIRYPDNTPTGDLLLILPNNHPLREDLVRLRPLWLEISGLRGTSRIAVIQACRRALNDKKVETPLARAALWDNLLNAAIQANQLTVDDVKALDQEPFHSPLFYRDPMAFAWPKDLRLARIFCAMLAKHCGSERLTENERQLLAIPWEQVPKSPGSPNWPNYP